MHDPNRSLELNFCSQKQVQPCIDALRSLTDIEFTVEVHGPDTREVLTKPAYLDIRSQAILQFASRGDLTAFISIPLMRKTHDKFASIKDGDQS